MAPAISTLKPHLPSFPCPSHQFASSLEGWKGGANINAYSSCSREGAGQRTNRYILTEAVNFLKGGTLGQLNH